MKNKFIGIFVIITMLLCATAIFSACGEGSGDVFPKKDSYTVVYKNLKTADAPTETSYKVKDGLLDLPELSVDGYNFKGWYTASEGGELIDYIPAGSTKDYVLFARWEAIRYKITYTSDHVNTRGYTHGNPAEYTVEESIKLEIPKFDNMIFNGWTDENGKAITEIPAGTVGNIELTANWRPYGSTATRCDNSLINAVYDEESGRYCFIYKIGFVDNIQLSKNKDVYDKNSEGDHTFTVSTSVTIDESRAEDISKAVGESLIKSSEWSNEDSWIHTNGSSSTAGGSIGGEIGGEAGNSDSMLSAKMLLKGSAEWSNTDFGEFTYESSSIDMFGEDREYSHTSTVVYSEQTTISNTTEKVISHTISTNAPNGWYEWVQTADLHVYGVVEYDPADGKFYISTVSVVGEPRTTLFYYPENPGRSGFSDEYGAFDFSIPKEDITAAIDKSYTVKYDPNGGEGVMHDSIHIHGSAQNLSIPKFTKKGYSIVGWTTNRESGAIEFLPSGKVTDLAESGSSITLYAIWRANSYTVSFDSDGVDMYDGISVTYGDAYGKLPVPEKISYNFIGWYLGDTLVTEDSVLNHDEDHTLTARWELKTFTVTLNVNSGSCSESSVTVAYGKPIDKLPTPQRSGYAFVGWFTSASGGVKISETDIIDNDMTVYAQWVATYFKHSETCRLKVDETASASGHKINTFLDVSKLRSLGYSKVKIRVTFTVEYENAGYRYVIVENSSGFELGRDVFSEDDIKTGVWTVEFIVDLTRIADGYINVYYWASGSGGDVWYMVNPTYEATVIK